MVLGSRDQESFGWVPIARFYIPVMAGENRVAHAGCKVKYFQRRIIRCGQEFSVTGRPCQVPDRVVVCVIDSLYVVEIRTPVFDVSFLPSRYQPVVVM